MLIFGFIILILKCIRLLLVEVKFSNYTRNLHEHITRRFLDTHVEIIVCDVMSTHTQGGGRTLYGRPSVGLRRLNCVTETPSLKGHLRMNLLKSFTQN